MTEDLRLRENLHWRRGKDWFNYTVYTPYTIKEGKRYDLAGVYIEKFDSDDISNVIYRLVVEVGIFCDYSSLQSAMVKAEEVLRDFKFRKDVNGKYLYIAYENDDNNYKVSHTIIGWKKAYDASHNGVIVKVRIPRGTRCNLTPTKCRAKKAEVVGVYRIARILRETESKLIAPEVSLVQLPNDTNIYSMYAVKSGKDVAYKSYNVGDTLEITDFDTTSDKCSSGIHFFRTLMKAINFEF